MPKYSIPCWIMTAYDFSIEVEAADRHAALAELHRLVTSSDEKDRTYVDECVANNGADGEFSYDGEIEWHNDIDCVEEIEVSNDEDDGC